MTNAVNMPEKLWDLANLITGFAIVQTLATTFALAEGELKIMKGPTAHSYAVIGTIIQSGGRPRFGIWSALPFPLLHRVTFEGGHGSIQD